MSPRAAVPRPLLLSSGPWKGVYDTPDPFDAAPDRLRDALNCYIPDPDAGSGVYGRNGFTENGLPGGAGARFRGFHQHTQLDGTVLNFMVVGGRIYRVSITAGTASYTDVTPTPNIYIADSTAAVWMVSMVSNEGATTESVIAFNDPVNSGPPCIISNLTATPVTFTQISYSTASGTNWRCLGKPIVWQGSVFFLNIVVGGVSRGQDGSWSEPGLPLTGYQQDTFDNNITLALGGIGPLTGGIATNLALYYFRQESAGVLYGDIATLRSTNTQDAVSYNIGAGGPEGMQLFGDYIYFTDLRGRPYRLRPGGPPEPIWRQMRGQTDAWTAFVAPTISSAIDPLRNLYLFVSKQDQSIIYVFDAASGTYMGRWNIFDNDDGTGGAPIDQLGVMSDVINRPFLCAGGMTGSTGIFGELWVQDIFGDSHQYVDWVGTGVTPNIKVTTDRLGESEGVVYLVDRAILLTGNSRGCKVTAETPNGSSTADNTAVTVPASSDGTYRQTVGFDGVQGRGPSLVVKGSQTTTSGQWSLHRADLVVTPSAAGPEEP